MGAARRNHQDGNQGKQGCVADHQEVSATEMSEIGIEAAAAA